MNRETLINRIIIARDLGDDYRQAKFDRNYDKIEKLRPLMRDTYPVAFALMDLESGVFENYTLHTAAVVETAALGAIAEYLRRARNHDAGFSDALEVPMGTFRITGDNVEFVPSVRLRTLHGYHWPDDYRDIPSLEPEFLRLFKTFAAYYQFVEPAKAEKKRIQNTTGYGYRFDDSEVMYHVHRFFQSIIEQLKGSITDESTHRTGTLDLNEFLDFGVIRVDLIDEARREYVVTFTPGTELLASA